MPSGGPASARMDRPWLRTGLARRQDPTGLPIAAAPQECRQRRSPATSSAILLVTLLTMFEVALLDPVLVPVLFTVLIVRPRFLYVFILFLF